MDSPRLRLIYLAGLRGFLKPDYKFGIQSYIREDLLIRTMVREMEYDTFKARGLIEAELLSVANPNRRNIVYQNSVSYLLQGHGIREMQPYRKVNDMHLKAKDSHSVKEAAAAFKVLKAADLYAKMDAVLAAN